jgi:hypothetical protein
MIKFVFSNLQLRGKKLEASLLFTFDIFEKTSTRSEVAGRSGQFSNYSWYKNTDASSLYRFDELDKKEGLISIFTTLTLQ